MTVLATVISCLASAVQFPTAVDEFPFLARYPRQIRVWSQHLAMDVFVYDSVEVGLEFFPESVAWDVTCVSLCECVYIFFHVAVELSHISSSVDEDFAWLWFRP